MSAPHLARQAVPAPSPALADFPEKALYSLADDHWYLAGYRRFILDCLKRFGARPGERLLDLGCGSGSYLAAVDGWLQGTGVDISAHAMRYSRERGLARLVRASGDALPFRDEVFDWVLVSSVLNLQNISDSLAVREARRVLARGGRLILVEPAFNALMGPHDRSFRTRERYRFGRLAAMLGDDFRILQHTYFNALMFPAMALFRLARRFFPVAGDRSELYFMPRLFNSALTMVLRVESLLLRRVRFPVGLSVVLVAERK